MKAGDGYTSCPLPGVVEASGSYGHRTLWKVGRVQECAKRAGAAIRNGFAGREFLLEDVVSYRNASQWDSVIKRGRIVYILYIDSDEIK